MPNTQMRSLLMRALFYPTKQYSLDNIMPPPKENKIQSKTWRNAGSGSVLNSFSALHCVVGPYKMINTTVPMLPYYNHITCKLVVYLQLFWRTSLG